LALITADIIYLKNCSGEKIGGIKYGHFGSNWSEKRERNNPSSRSNPDRRRQGTEKLRRKG
jgi:hypothetical protein